MRAHHPHALRTPGWADQAATPFCNIKTSCATSVYCESNCFLRHDFCAHHHDGWSLMPRLRLHYTRTDAFDQYLHQRICKKIMLAESREPSFQRLAYLRSTEICSDACAVASSLPPPSPCLRAARFALALGFGSGERLAHRHHYYRRHAAALPALALLTLLSRPPSSSSSSITADFLPFLFRLPVLPARLSSSTCPPVPLTFAVCVVVFAACTTFSANAFAPLRNRAWQCDKTNVTRNIHGPAVLHDWPRSELLSTQPYSKTRTVVATAGSG